MIVWQLTLPVCKRYIGPVCDAVVKKVASSPLDQVLSDLWMRWEPRIAYWNSLILIRWKSFAHVKKVCFLQITCLSLYVLYIIGKDAKVKGLAAPSNLSMNQTLEGHSGKLLVMI